MVLQELTLVGLRQRRARWALGLRTCVESAIAWLWRDFTAK